MFQLFYKLIFVFTTNLIISVPIYAKAVEQKSLNFPVKTVELLKGEVHYFAEVISPRKLAKKHPEVFDLDALSLIQEKNVMIMVTKTISIVNKPVGFFDQKQMMDERYLAHVLGEAKVKNISPDTFKITVPASGISYKLQAYFDADDVSTLPNSKVTMAVNGAKKLDVISQGASTIMFTAKTDFSRSIKGGITVSSFIPMKEGKTLIISYNLWSIKKPVSNEKELLNNFENEIQAVKKLIENYNL